MGPRRVISGMHRMRTAGLTPGSLTQLPLSSAQLYEDVSEEEGWRQIRAAYQNAKVTWGKVWHLEDMLAGLPSSPLVDTLRRQLPAGETRGGGRARSAYFVAALLGMIWRLWAYAWSWCMGERSMILFLSL